MKNEKLFNETIDKLVKAYFEGDLRHQDCSACAVGNILGTNHWMYHFVTSSKRFECIGNTIYRQREDGYTQMEFKTESIFPYSEYSKSELMDIEWAFETAPKEGDWEFNGLMCVVDVLEKIHECDKETTTITKQRFVKQLV